MCGLTTYDVLIRLYKWNFNFLPWLFPDGPFTVLAPTDTAFESVDVGGLIANKTELTRVLTRHVIAAKVYAADVGTGPIETLGGEIIQGATEGTGDNIKVTFAFGQTVANVIEANIEASNGIIHVLDQVL